MAKYLLIVDYDPGVAETPMEQCAPEDIKAHMDYYRALSQELIDSGELVDNQALTGPEHAGRARRSPACGRGSAGNSRRLRRGERGDGERVRTSGV